MIDNMLSYVDEALLICPRLNKNNSFVSFRKFFNLHSKKKIKIDSIFKYFTLNSVFLRLIYGLKVALKLKGEKNLIISRSIISSVFLTLFKVKHFLDKIDHWYLPNKCKNLDF